MQSFSEHLCGNAARVTCNANCEVHTLLVTTLATLEHCATVFTVLHRNRERVCKPDIVNALFLNRRRVGLCIDYFFENFLNPFCHCWCAYYAFVFSFHSGFSSGKA